MARRALRPATASRAVYVLVVVVGIVALTTQSPAAAALPKAAHHQHLQHAQQLPLLQDSFRAVTASPSSAALQSCIDVPAPNAANVQRCCYGATRGEFACLPSLVIVGAQKAGTTVLHAHLIGHPSIRASRVKEFHLFDANAFYYDFLHHAWMRRVGTVDSERAHERITLDSTPEYVVNTMGCQRLARHLHPSAALVFVVRHPVHRTWSQLKMIFRRHVLRKLDFLAHLDAGELAAISACVRDKACVVPPYTASNATHVVLVEFVFYCKTASLTAVGACLSSPPALQRCLDGSGGNPLMDFVTGGPKWTLAVRELAPKIADLRRTMAFFRNNASFVCSSCGGSGALGSLKLGFSNEVCTGCRCSCAVPFQAPQFLWKSLYRPQIEHCLEHIPRQRLLILDFDDVQRNVSKALRQIVTHAGLAPHTFGPTSAAMERFHTTYPDFSAGGWAENATRAYTTHLQLSKSLERELSRFFAHDHDAVRRLTGLRLASWSSP